MTGTDQAWKRTRIDSPKIGCQRVISVKCDSKTIEESGVAQIRKLGNKSTTYSRQKDKRQISCSKPRDKQNAHRLKKPPGPCYHCGKWHWMKFYPVKKKKYCKNCNKNGHNLTQCWYANISRKPKSYSTKSGSLWRLHYCFPKDELAKSETMFARKVKSVLDKLIPRQAKFK